MYAKEGSLKNVVISSNVTEDIRNQMENFKEFGIKLKGCDEIFMKAKGPYF